MKRYLTGIIFCAIGLTTLGASPLQHPNSGRIDRKYIYSPEMKDTMTVDIWVPDYYTNHTDCRLPVVYMHDGQNLFDATTTWNGQSWNVDSVAEKLVSENRMAPVIIVGIHSAAKSRKGDMMPEDIFDNPQLRQVADNMLETPIRGNAYAKFVSTTLRDSINASYRTLPDAENTAVMGSSMGGLMSLYILCEYPEVFSKAGCLSTHWVGSVEDYANGDERFPQAMYEYVKQNLPRDGKHKIYFDHGTATIDAYYDKWNDKVVDLCKEAGYTPDKLSTFIDQGASHEENAWMKRVWRPLVFLFPTK